MVRKARKTTRPKPKITDPHSRRPKQRLGFTIAHESKLPHEGQYLSSGKIKLGNKTFELTREGRRGVLMHEVGHELADRMARDLSIFDLASSGAFGRCDSMGRPAGFSGIGERPDEFVADAYAYLINDPTYLKKRFPIAYREIKKRAKIEGFPVSKSGFDKMMGDRLGSKYRKTLSKPVKGVTRPSRTRKGLDPSLFRVDW